MKASGTPPPPPQVPAQQAHEGHEAHEAHHAEHAHHEAACPWVQQRMQQLAGRYRFRPAPGQAPVPGRVPPNLANLRRRPPPRTRTNARGGQDDPTSGVDDHEEHERLGDKEDTEGKGGGRQAFDFHEEPEHDFQHDQKHRDDAAERRALQARVGPKRENLSAGDVLARSGLPGAKLLDTRRCGQPVDPKALLAALASVLVACGQGARPTPAPSAAPAPSDTAVVLAAMQSYLERQPDGVPEPITLEGAKAMLMDDVLASLANTGTGQRNENLLLLLPLYLINATRVRTGDQLGQAIARLQVLRSAPGMG